MRFTFFLFATLVAHQAQAFCLSAPDLTDDPVLKELAKLRCQVEEQSAEIRELRATQLSQDSDLSRIVLALDRINRVLDR